MQERLGSVLARVREWWKKYNNGQRIRIIGVAAVVLVALIVTAVLAFRPNMVEMMKLSSYTELSNVRSSLEAAGITYSVTNDLVVLVDERQINDAMADLEVNNVITDPRFTYLTALQYNSLGTTEDTRSMLNVLGKQDELQEVIKKVTGVKGASVILDIPKSRSFLLNDSEPTASVMLETTQTLGSDQAETIARIVLRGVANLKIENILVTDQSGKVLFDGVSRVDSNSITSQQDAKSFIESSYEAKIKRTLNGMYDSIDVMANIDLNWTKITQNEQKYTNPTGEENNTGLVDSEIKSNQTMTGTDSSGAPGLDSNDQSQVGYEIGAGGSSSAKISESTSQYIYDNMTKLTEFPTGDIVREKSSIAVTLKRFKTYNEEEFLKDPQGMTWEAFQEANSEISVLEVSEDIIEHLKAGTGLENINVIGYLLPEFIDMVPTQINFEQIAILVILALLFIMIAFGLIRRTQPDEVVEIEPELSVESLLVSTQLEEQAEIEKQRLHDIEIGVDSEVKRQIEKFVNEKPDSAAQLLRNWLNEEWE